MGLTQKVFGMLWIALALLGPELSAQENPKNSAPSGQSHIPLSIGSVEAVTGEVSLAVPIGPRLPGRIPAGFTWTYSSNGAWGWFRPIVWPYPTGTPDPNQIEVSVFGEQYRFLKRAAPVAGMPSEATLRSWMSKRGVDDGFFEASGQHNPTAEYPDPVFTIKAFYPSSDGTKFYADTAWWIGKLEVIKIDPRTGEPVTLETSAQVASRRLVIDGPTAIWTADGKITKVSNRWGDLVSVTETAESPQSAPHAPFKIVIKNELVPSHTITLAVTPGGTKKMYPPDYVLLWEADATLVKVTNTLPNGAAGNLPDVELFGKYKVGAEVYADPCFPDSGQVGWLSTGGIYAESITTIASNGERKATQIEWIVTGYPSKITQANGLIETISWEGQVAKLSSASIDPCNGQYWGYRPDPASSSTSLVYLANGSSARPAVSQITWIGSGLGRTTRISRRQPLIQNRLWVQREHTTTILNFPTAIPMNDTPYRGWKLTHPSASGNPYDYASSKPYEFQASVVMKAESIRGVGVAEAGSYVNLEGSRWEPTNPTIDQTVLYDGWDVRSWANPATDSGVFPSNPVATRTRVYTPKKYTHIIIAADRLKAASRDDRGPLRTDEYWEDPTPEPAINGDSTLIRFGDLPAQSDSLRRTGIITRRWNEADAVLQVTSDEKKIGGSRLSQLRSGAGSELSFGVTSPSYIEGGLVTSRTGARTLGGVATNATETITYGLTSGTGKPLPVVTRSEKTLKVGGTAKYLNPANTAVKAGVEYTYDTTPYRWLLAEKDLSDGRPVTYTRDELGRENKVIDQLGVSSTTSYNAWGAVESKVREARGSIGAVTKTYASDPAGTWASETVQADGNSIHTRITFDAQGRKSRIDTYLGSSPNDEQLLTTQSFGYDEWGRLKWESPVLKKGQTPYGNQTYAYTDKGILKATYDPKGRRVSSIFDPANPDVVFEPEVGTYMGITGLIVKTWDARGYLRVEIYDALGQKIALVDQANQLSTYEYDGDGHLIRTVQGTQVRTYSYDSMGWLLSRTEPEEGTTVFSNHTMLGVPLTATLKGRPGTPASKTWETTTTINQYLQPITIVAKNTGGTEATVTRTLNYNPTTRLLSSMSEVQLNGTLSEQYGYDDLFRFNTKTVSDGTTSFVVSRTMDAMGNVTSLTLPAAGGRASQVVTYGFDSQWRPNSVKLGNVDRGTMNYAPAMESAVETILSFGNTVTTRHKVDKGELVLTEHAVLNHGGLLKKPDGTLTLLESNPITWDAAGLMLNRGGDEFQYDSLQRLVYAKSIGINPGEVTTQTFAYDRWGNRISSDFTYTGPSKPEELMKWSYTSTGSNDLPGSISTPGGSVSTNVVYDQAGRISTVDAVPGLTAHRVSWVYDPTGRIVKETTGGVLSTFLLDSEGLRFKKTTGTTVAYTLYGFSKEPLMYFEKVGTGALTWKKSLVYGFGQLISEEKATGTTYVQGDQVGSPNLITNQSGTVVGRTKNLPFGERYGQLGAEKSTRRFTNHEDQTGSAIYMQARTYLPVFGKFAQVDPAYDQTKDDPESWNLYNYVTNNPITKTDPDGRRTLTLKHRASGATQSVELSPTQEAAYVRGEPVLVELEDGSHVLICQSGEVMDINAEQSTPTSAPDQTSASKAPDPKKAQTPAQTGAGGQSTLSNPLMVGMGMGIGVGVDGPKTPPPGAKVADGGSAVVEVVAPAGPDPVMVKERAKVSSCISGAGIGATLVQSNAGIRTLGTNLKLYQSGWIGGSRAAIKTFRISQVAQKGGNYLAGVGVMLDAYRLHTGEIDGFDFTLNTSASAAGFWFPPVPVIYFGVQLINEGPRSPDIRDHYVRGVGFRP